MSPTLLYFVCESTVTDGERRTELRTVTPQRLVIAGWAGRDVARVEHHIEELAALGVPRPSAVPLYYNVATQMLTQADSIEVLGPHSSGEVEPMLFTAGGEWWLTVASDHTDRKVEGYSVAASKQACAKPVAQTAWRWRDVQAHQDDLELRSSIVEDGRWVPYQRGTLSELRPLAQLCAGWLQGRALVDGLFLSCGTIAAMPNADGCAIRSAREMEIELIDPRFKRRIVHRYAAEALEVVA